MLCIKYNFPYSYWKSFPLFYLSSNLWSRVWDSVFGCMYIHGRKCQSYPCISCLSRYSREEPFTALNVDIRNQQHLFESLDVFVKGDLLEGANAYHCDKCDKKVDTVKRMCIKKLPKILCIQLKRFDYDWERLAHTLMCSCCMWQFWYNVGFIEAQVNLTVWHEIRLDTDLSSKIACGYCSWCCKPCIGSKNRHLTIVSWGYFQLRT